MKQCPSCRKTYPDDLFFCLDDGTRLDGSYDHHSALTEENPQLAAADRTEILFPNTETVNDRRTKNLAPPRFEPASKKRTSSLPYVVIGMLVLACIALGSALVIQNRDRLIGTDTAPSPTPTRTPRPFATPFRPAAGPDVTDTPEPRTSPTIKQYVAGGVWKGEWRTDSGTLFDFDLTLNAETEDTLSGTIKWTMRKTARDDKTSKIGLSAVERVRGTFSPATGAVRLKGYSKDDPNDVLVMLDEYNLQISADGQKLTGLARNGGKWNGRVALAKVDSLAH